MASTCDTGCCGNGQADPTGIAVYVHVPFCRTRCPYCDFASAAVPGEAPAAYTDALCAEIASFEGPPAADTVFFGGGTPSLLAPGALERILGALSDRFRLDSPEITLEANPDDLTEELADAWRAAGVNRVSLGVQSLDDGVLRYLGRRHDAATARRACAVIAERFENWAMDLIFGARPVTAWNATLRECRALAPPHVSAYGLTYEEGTPFGERSREAVDEDAWLALYRRAESELDGYRHYEISNYARPGAECRHNLRYWRNQEYAGFGPAAYSFLDGARSRNPETLDAYLAAPGVKAESLRLTPAEIRVETLIQHFRLRDGLSRRYYAMRFGRPVDEDFGAQLGVLMARGLLRDGGEVIHPTDRGFELNNEIGMALLG